MIVTVTSNPALDVTYGLDRLVPNDTHRARWVHQRAGGKGVNVARVLRGLGYETRVVATTGGATGGLVAEELTAAGLRHDLSPVSGETRRTVALVGEQDETTTLLNEPGTVVSHQEWGALGAAVRRVSAMASVLVFAGSLPPGAPQDGYARLIELAHAQGVPTVLDTSGAALREGVAAGPDIVKPNAAELAELTTTADPAMGATKLRELGARDVVVSLGSDGMLGVTAEGTWHAKPFRAVRGNPTGAGDAAVAALAVGLRDGTHWHDRLREAVAVSTAAVIAPVAGDIDADHYRDERTVTRVWRSETGETP